MVQRATDDQDRRPQLTRERVVAEALAAIANDGAQALTMRGLAARLGVVPGALYRHVRNKEQLQDLVLDGVLAEVDCQVDPAMAWTQQISMHQPTEWYVRPDGALDVPKLMAAWQAFWRKDGHLAAEGFGYREAGPHLMLMAFLQRIVNGGGRVEREYGLGRGALDLMIFWKAERHAIEVKIRRDTDTEAEALDQVVRYLDRAGLGEGWLITFDLRKELPWADKLFAREVEHAAKTIRIVGC